MAYVSLPEVQQWLEATKLTLTTYDTELEGTAKEVVFDQVGAIYDTSTWSNSTSTPALIRKILSMLIAAWTYDRAYSEDIPQGSGYGFDLESKAMTLLSGIVEGSIDIPTAEAVQSTLGTAAFYPTDAQSVEDNLGTPNPEDRKFAMGSIF